MTRIFIVGLVSGEPHFAAGKWVKSYNPWYVNPEHGYDGGLLEVTENEREAQEFPNVEWAISVWRSVAPEPYRIRADGKLNRPLTSFTVEFRQ